MLAGRLFPRALAVTWLLDSNAAPLPGRRETMILVEGQPNDGVFSLHRSLAAFLGWTRSASTL